MVLSLLLTSKKVSFFSHSISPPLPPHFFFFFLTFSQLGDLIERGIMRRLPEGFDGNTSPYVFTWSTERPCKVWGMGSGCAPFYNTAKEGDGNTNMVRYFDEDRFEIFAARDIEAGEELSHTYISLGWRKCFSELNTFLNEEKA